jgi:hypothetical protein
MHPLDVPGHSNQAPLAAEAIEPAQQELSESITDLMIPTPALESACADRRVVCLAVSAAPGHGFDRRRVFRAGGGAANRSRQEG